MNPQIQPRQPAGLRASKRVPMFILGWLLMVSVNNANAGPRAGCWDDEVVQRSELIVLGHLKSDSIQYVAHTNGPSGGRSWEHHAILVITSMLKGTTQTNEIPIIIHYGLEPVVNGHSEHEGFMMDMRGTRPDYPTNLIQIFDTGSSAFSSAPLVEDAGQENIWFLRKLTGIYGREAGGETFGVADPEDMQPLKLKGYFELFLNPHPEEALKAYALAHPELAVRIQFLLDHKTIVVDWETIKGLQDPSIKARKMAVYLRKATAPSRAGELYGPLRKEMPKLGSNAVPVLMEVIRAGMTNGEDLNQPVLILYDIGKPAQPAVPVLLELLEKPGQTSRYYICSALKTAGDKSAIPYLRPMLKVDDLQTAVEAAQALEALGDKESFAAVAEVLERVNPKDSMAKSFIHDLVKVLHKMDGKLAEPIVKKICSDPFWAKDAWFFNPEL